MKNHVLRALACSLALAVITTSAMPSMSLQAAVRTEGRVSVHDPSIFKANNGKYYVFGSHVAAASSDDLINWKQISSDYSNTENNPIYGNIKENLKESFKWAGYDDGDCSNGGLAVWAPDVYYNEDYKWDDGSKGAYMLYYCTSSTWRRSCIGYAVSKNVEGPYDYVDTIVYSGFTKTGATDGKSTRNTKWDNDYLNLKKLTELGADQGGIDGINEKWFRTGGQEYNTDYAPNAIDPTVFNSPDGKLYMVYGSWSGGLYVLELDKETGKAIYPGKDGKDEESGNYIDRYFGTHIAGANHQSGEGPYIRYDEQTGYYYMYETYAGLTATGGYNMRLFRSKNVYGPYVDAAGRNAADSGKGNAEYGIKLIGNYRFLNQPGYRAAGHNSAFVDDDGSRYLISHQRFDEPENQTERHEVRVRQQFMNEDGWPVTAVYEYDKEKIDHYDDQDVLGTYEIVNHGSDNGGTMIESQTIELNADGTITGAQTGTWTKTKAADYDYVTLKIGDNTYKGVFFKQRNEENEAKEVMTFTTIGDNNQCIWGSKLDLTDDLTISLAEGKVKTSLPGNTNEDIQLLSEAKGATITWKSSNEAVLSSEGKVTRGKEDVKVTLTASIKAGDTTKEFNYDVVVNGLSKKIYAFDFENKVVDGKIAGKTQTEKEGVATLKGTAKIEEDAERGKVLSIVSPTEVYNENMLQLPENVFSDVTAKGYTVSMWVNCGADIFEHSALFNSMTNGTYPMTRLGVNLCGRINANGYVDGGYYNQILRGTGWHHVAYSISASGLKTWVDGKLLEKVDKDLKDCFDANRQSSIQYSKDARIGSGSPWTDRDIENAKFDDVAIYDGELTEAEVGMLVKGEEINPNVEVKDTAKTEVEDDKKPEVKKLKTGDKFTSGKETYKVTSAKNKTVAVVSTKATSKTLAIASTVKKNNVTYKVTSVADNAFKNNKKITAVKGGKYVTAIGKNAFYKAGNLKTVSLDSKSIKTIGKSTFEGDKNLKTITLKTKSLKTIGSNALKGIYKKAVVKVPSSKVKTYKKLITAKKVGAPKTIKVTK